MNHDQVIGMSVTQVSIILLSQIIIYFGIFILTYTYLSVCIFQPESNLNIIMDVDMLTDHNKNTTNNQGMVIIFYHILFCYFYYYLTIIVVIIQNLCGINIVARILI